LRHFGDGENLIKIAHIEDRILEGAGNITALYSGDWYDKITY